MCFDNALLFFPPSLMGSKFNITTTSHFGLKQKRMPLRRFTPFGFPHHYPHTGRHPVGFGSALGIFSVSARNGSLKRFIQFLNKISVFRLKSSPRFDTISHNVTHSLTQIGVPPVPTTSLLLFVWAVLLLMFMRFSVDHLAPLRRFADISPRRPFPPPVPPPVGPRPLWPPRSSIAHSREATTKHQ